MVAYALLVVEDVTTIYKETKMNSQAKDWKDVMDKKIGSLHTNFIWDLIELPKGEKDIGCKWVFDMTDDPFSQERVKYRARLVAKSYMINRKELTTMSYSLRLRNILQLEFC